MNTGSILIKSQGHDWRKVKKHYDAVGVSYEEWDNDKIKEMVPVYDMHEHWPVRRPEDPEFFNEPKKMLEGALFCPEGGYVNDPVDRGGEEVMSWIYTHNNPYYPKDNKPLIWAWNIDTGKVVWQKDLSEHGTGGNDCGLCLMDGELYYSTFFGYSSNQRRRRGLPDGPNGITARLDPATEKAAADRVWDLVSQEIETRSQDPERRQQIRERWKNLTPEQRERFQRERFDGRR